MNSADDSNQLPPALGLRRRQRTHKPTFWEKHGVSLALVALFLGGLFLIGLNKLGMRSAFVKSSDGASRVTQAQAMTPIDHSQYPSIVLGMGCFWGAEKRMHELNGVVDVEAGYAGGDDPNPSYDRPNDARPNGQYPGKSHAEVVRVYYDPQVTNVHHVLAQFWQSHNPTQGNRQGNDVGENYRSAIFYQTEAERDLAERTRAQYQSNLQAAGKTETITTEISALRHYKKAEDYHQDYLLKNPNGYCGLGGMGVAYVDPNLKMPIAAPVTVSHESGLVTQWDKAALNPTEQLIAFEADYCAFCKKFNAEIGDTWQHSTPLVKTHLTTPPKGWTLKEGIFATPTIVYFKNKMEVARFTGYTDASKFWQWWAYQSLTDAQKKIAFAKGTEPPFTGGLLDEKRSGTYVDPVSGVPLFRSDAKFNSGTGWPSFFDPLPNAVLLKPEADGRTEVISASSGIHLGHVFDDGPPPTHKRFCINSEILKFIPNPGQ